MRLFSTILLLSYSIFAQSEEKIPADIQKKIDEAVDYYNVYLFEDSKKLLLEVLYSDEGEKYEAEIRYHLGLASYTEGLKNVAGKQWTILRKKYPTSSRAREISRVFSSIMQEHQSDSLFAHESFEFQQEIQYSNLFWNPKYATRKLFYGELIEPSRAVEYYENLLNKYDDPDKKFIIAWRLFYLYAGFNHNGYGFNNQNSYGQQINGNKYAKYALGNFKLESIRMLNLMESYVKDEDDPNFNLLVQSNYVFAVRLSDEQFWSEKIKPNVQSEPFFVKVLDLTENSSTNNIYRTFATLWLGDEANKYIVSNELLNEWEPLGLSKKNILGLRKNKIPKEYWAQLIKKNVSIDYTQTLPKTFLINLKLETLLKEKNLLNKYKPEDLENEIANIDKGYKIYLLNRFNMEDDNLIEWLINKFEYCNDLECLNAHVNAITANIKFIMDQKRVSTKKAQDLYMLRQSISISTLILIKMNNIEITDLTQIIEKNTNMLAE